LEASRYVEVLVLAEVPIVEAGLRQIFGEQPEFTIVHVCRSQADALQAAQRLRPKVVLCNVAPDAPLNLIYEICGAAPESAVVLFARWIPASLAQQALHMGVRAIVSTTVDLDRLLECLRAVAAGQTWVEGSLAAEIVSMRRVSLTPRQKDVLDLLVRGFKNKEIAFELGLSVGTVKAYLTALFEKVGAKDRFELALFGLKYVKHGKLQHTAVDRPSSVRPAA
jgi:DNA-binding NarL/FixJ family response regulator